VRDHRVPDAQDVICVRVLVHRRETVVTVACSPWGFAVALGTS
jgi:hypothetical protein